jgi:small GTP-binding protein
MNSHRFKVVMLGNSGVGKTALVNQISQNTFHPNHIPTVGSQFVMIEVTVGGTSLLFEVWDTAGQEVYRSLVGFYARDSRGAFIVMDITSHRSFTALADWIRFVHTEAPEAKLVIFANKADLKSERVVGTEEIATFAKQNNCDFVEGSARTGMNVSDAFVKMGELILALLEEKTSKVGKTGVEIAANSGTQKNCC